MSEPTRDPIEALKTLGTGGVPVNPLDPATVRRLGDKRRRRQNTMYGTIAAVVLAVAIVPTAILATGDRGTDKPGITHTPIPDPTPPVIEYTGNGVSVKNQADLAKLEGTTQEFKTFIGTVLEQDRSDGCTQPEIRVSKYSGSGYASGGVGGCGGYQALWVLNAGNWSEALSTQDEWLCGDLNRFSIPESFAGRCYGPKEVFGPGSDAGLALGMTMDQVRAAGGTVSAPSSDGNDFCRTVNPKGFPDTVSPDGSTTSVVGYLSLQPNRGVVALFAQKDQVTPRGIRTGDLLATFKKAYPEATMTGSGWYRVNIDDTSHYRFDIDQDGKVQNVSLELDGPQGCYE